jgi:hypothetical protein
MAVDISALSYFAPIFSFLLVFVVIFAVLAKTKIIGESKFVQLFVSFLIATMFVVVGSVREYVLTITPWIAVFIVSAAFILALTGFLGVGESVKKGIGVVFVIALAIMFLISGIVVFSGVVAPYLPGSSASGGSQNILQFTEWLWSGKVMGAVLVLIIAGIVSWVLVKAK